MGIDRDTESRIMTLMEAYRLSRGEARRVAAGESLFDVRGGRKQDSPTLKKVDR